MVDYLYVDLESGNLKPSVKGGMSGVPGKWHPVVWVNTLGDTPNDRIMSTIAGVRSWLQSSKSHSVSTSAVIETPVDLTILDSEPMIQSWQKALKSECMPAPFPYMFTSLMGATVLQISYDLTNSLQTLQDEKLWVKIEHNPAKPGTIQLPGGISCASCDADPSQNGGTPVEPATPGQSGRPGPGGGGGGGGPPGPPGPGSGGPPSAPAPFPGPAGACESDSDGGDGEPSAAGSGEGEGDPSDSESGGSWGIWYGGDK